MWISRRLCESAGGYVNQQEVMWISRRLCDNQQEVMWHISRRLCENKLKTKVKAGPSRVRQKYLTKLYIVFHSLCFAILGMQYSTGSLQSTPFQNPGVVAQALQRPKDVPKISCLILHKYMLWSHNKINMTSIASLSFCIYDQIYT